MFNIRLSPIVKNLIIVNVVVFLLIYAIRRMLETGSADPATLVPILNDYTALYKTNLLGFFGGAYESNFKTPTADYPFLCTF